MLVHWRLTKFRDGPSTNTKCSFRVQFPHFDTSAERLFAQKRLAALHPGQSHIKDLARRQVGKPTAIDLNLFSYN
ncbi:hypothetical protein ES702_00255 [subsurface metagenome]